MYSVVFHMFDLFHIVFFCLRSAFVLTTWRHPCIPSWRWSLTATIKQTRRTLLILVSSTWLEKSSPFQRWKSFQDAVKIYQGVSHTLCLKVWYLMILRVGPLHMSEKMQWMILSRTLSQSKFQFNFYCTSIPFIKSSVITC